MFKVTRWLIWVVVSLAVLAVLDQFLIRAALPVPGFVQVQEFYIDFRGRLLGITGVGSTGGTIEQMIEAKGEQPNIPEKASPAPRFLYVDKDGNLQFADSLEDVPRAYRKDAQPMSE